jgi:hypothetical protein
LTRLETAIVVVAAAASHAVAAWLGFVVGAVLA